MKNNWVIIKSSYNIIVSISLETLLESTADSTALKLLWKKYIIFDSYWHRSPHVILYLKIFYTYNNTDIFQFL